MLAFSHGNEKGTGSRLEVDMKPATEAREGSVVLRLRPQSNMKGGAEWDGPKFARFDSVEIEVGVAQVSHMLQVLDGNAKSILGSKGARARRSDSSSALFFDRATSPFDGYAVHMQCSDLDGNRRDGRIVLNLVEGAALRDALRASMGRIAFG